MSRVILYILRRDLRVVDNPILHHLGEAAKQSQAHCTHLLPVYVFPAQQIETSGFLRDGARSPYPEARSQVGNFWRCGKARATFLAESVYALRSDLEAHGSGMEVRAGMMGDVVSDMLDGFAKVRGDASDIANETTQVVGIWMTADEGVEERQEERAVKKEAERRGIDFRLWHDEKFLVDDRDLPFGSIKELPNLYTSYRKMVEPLRAVPRACLPKPQSIPPLPTNIPQSTLPFEVPSTLDGAITALHQPLDAKPDLGSYSAFPEGSKTAHPFTGGAKAGHERIEHLVATGAMTTYKSTRNGLLGEDFSTKLSAWLAVGCITARQVHAALVEFEDGKGSVGKDARGYGGGENAGTYWIRFELLWRDYMRLCARKWRSRLFALHGFHEYDSNSAKWRVPSRKDPEAGQMLARWQNGTTGLGLVDASMRELWHTGWQSNRARQNAASFFAKRLDLDWRIGAEWFESLLVDHDVASNWGNWQAVSLTDRAFNAVKQAYDYDDRGEYVKAWMPELRGINDVEALFQSWKGLGKGLTQLKGLEMAEAPLARIEYRPKPKGKDGPKKKGKGKGPKNNRANKNT